MEYRLLRTISEFRQVVALEREIWGYTDEQDVVPVPIFIITTKRGGLLIGAFDEGRLAGFAYSLPGLRDGRLLQWSHMLGVAEAYRNSGVGRQLKIEQRRLTLAMGIDLIEWTFDPLQAVNAHFNFVKLGAIAEQYEENVYGESSSVLHRGTATDRLIARWWLRDSRVEERLARAGGSAGHSVPPDGAEVVLDAQPRGECLVPRKPRLDLAAPKLLVTIPAGFSQMQLARVELARSWRAATRAVFMAYLERGYRVEDFLLDRARQRGQYLLIRQR